MFYFYSYLLSIYSVRAAALTDFFGLWWWRHWGPENQDNELKDSKTNKQKRVTAELGDYFCDFFSSHITHCQYENTKYISFKIIQLVIVIIKRISV